MYDEVEIDDSTRSIQFTLNAENGHTEFIECDPPNAKRARLDINYSIAPASAFINGNSNATIQPIQKQSFQNQMQFMQQQQNRRKIALVNRMS